MVRHIIGIALLLTAGVGAISLWKRCFSDVSKSNIEPDKDYRRKYDGDEESQPSKPVPSADTPPEVLVQQKLDPEGVQQPSSHVPPESEALDEKDKTRIDNEAVIGPEGVVQETDPLATKGNHIEPESMVCEPRKDDTQTPPTEWGRGLPGKPRKPEDIPRRRGSKSREKSQTKSRESDPLKQPQVICWNENQVWHIGLETSVTHKNLKLIQDDQELHPHERVDGRVSLRNLIDSIEVNTEEDDYTIDSPLSQENQYALFKLQGSSCEFGRMVQKASKGMYLVIMPAEWSRDLDESGPEIIAPQQVAITGYTAHFFNLLVNGKGRMVFRNQNNESLEVLSSRIRFELVGNAIPDASDHGPLFAIEPPKLRAIDGPQIWEEVSRVTVVEEGPLDKSRERFRGGFKPSQGQIDQTLGESLQGIDGGWFSVRIWSQMDDSFNLIDSLDFRFARPLHAIRIQSHPYLPANGGHSPVTIDFDHRDGLSIRLAETSSQLVQFERRPGEGTSALVPSNPDVDQTDWRIELGEDIQVPIKIHLNRIWWNLGEEHGPPQVWTDELIELERAYCLPTSSKVLWFRFPCEGWVEGFRIGISQDHCWYNRLTTKERYSPIRLRELGSYDEIEDTQRNISVRIWIDDSDSDSPGFTVAEFPIVRQSQKGHTLAETTAEKSIIDSDTSSYIKPKPWIQPTKPQLAPPRPKPSVTVSLGGFADFSSINEAIKNVEGGYRVIVEPGIYPENIVIDKNIEIVGVEHEDINRTQIHPSDGPCIDMQTEYALVRNLALECFSQIDPAVIVGRGRLILQRSIISTKSDTCVVIHGVESYARIQLCIITGANKRGIHVLEGGEAEIQHCTIRNLPCGIEVETEGFIAISDKENSITRCEYGIRKNKDGHYACNLKKVRWAGTKNPLGQF